MALVGQLCEFVPLDGSDIPSWNCLALAHQALHILVCGKSLDQHEALNHLSDIGICLNSDHETTLPQAGLQTGITSQSRPPRCERSDRPKSVRTPQAFLVRCLAMAYLLSLMVLKI